MSVEKCIQCGICKVNCPIFKVILKESVSPRGLTFLAKKENTIKYEMDLKK